MRQILTLIFVLIGLSFTSFVFACKMTELGYSSHAMQAVLSHMATDTKQPDRQILSIKKLTSNESAFRYLVITTKERKNCEAFVYEVNFMPSCETSVRRIKHEPCRL